MKIQITLEFIIIVSVVVLVAVGVIAFYFNYSYSSARYVHINSPNFIQQLTPLNKTNLLLVTYSNIPSKTLNITFLFKPPSNSIIQTLNYIVVNESKTQNGAYAYLLYLTSNSQYNPANTSYEVCDVGYKFDNKNIEVSNITNC